MVSLPSPPASQQRQWPAGAREGKGFPFLVLSLSFLPALFLLFFKIVYTSRSLHVTALAGNFLVFDKQRTPNLGKLTWLVLGEDPAARSHRVEQFTAL